MSTLTLTPDQLQALKVAHREARRKNAKEAYKLNAIILLGSGWSVPQVAAALLLDDDTVRYYAARYQEGGIKALLATFHKGSSARLSADQLMQLEKELDSRIYQKTAAVCEYVEETFGVTYSLSGITDVLHRLGYTYKKPHPQPAHPDPIAQEDFVAYYLEFMQKKSAKDEVVFVDAVHPLHSALAGYGWIKKGERRELKSNAGRLRLNIHGAMNAESYETVIVASESAVNAEATLALFEQIEATYPEAENVYVILDNARYHYSSFVQEWVKGRRIKLVFLPAYSPQLNLIERLWKIFKKKVLYNRYYDTFEKFKKACLGFFRNQSDYSDDIRSTMGEGLAAFA